MKPSNVLVEPSGRVVILDFGLVADVEEAGRAMTEVEVVGTPAYMAPEQAASRAVGPAADWYAVGVLLYEAMTGEVPFNGAPLEVLLRKQKDEPPPPSALVSGLPADLSDLCARLLRFDPAARPTGKQVLRALDAAGSSGARAPEAMSSSSTSLGVPLVGREEQLAQLRSAYDDVRASGRAVTVVVGGESGIGKSSLVRHFTELTAAHATLDQQLVLFAGRCYEREAVPYKALDGVVDDIARFLSRARARARPPSFSRPAPRRSIQMFPVLRRIEAINLLRTPDDAVADVHELRTRAFAAMRELLVRVADRKPLIVVIDDLQWADGDSLALLNALLRPPDEPSLLLLVVTMRDEPRDAAASLKFRTSPDVAIPGEVRRMKLSRLGKDDARALTSRLVERLAPGLAVQIDALAAEADGHPLFIDEIVRHLFAVGGSHGELKLEDALWTRIRSLDALPRQIVELCAIAGTPLPQDAMTRAVEADPSEFARLVSFLRVAHLVRTSGTRGVDVIECFHGRIRDAVLGHLSPLEKTDRHASIAVALESHPDADPDLLALMWLGAGDLDKAAKHTLAAADRAGAALAFDRAASLYERALELRSQGTRPTSRAEHRALET